MPARLPGTSYSPLGVQSSGVSTRYLLSIMSQSSSSSPVFWVVRRDARRLLSPCFLLFAAFGDNAGLSFTLVHWSMRLYLAAKRTHRISRPFSGTRSSFLLTDGASRGFPAVVISDFMDKSENGEYWKSIDDGENGQAGSLAPNDGLCRVSVIEVVSAVIE
jgi:hypothetical protein